MSDDDGFEKAVAAVKSMRERIDARVTAFDAFTDVVQKAATAITEFGHAFANGGAAAGHQRAE